MAYEGSLAESPFPEVLQTIGRNAETGILTLQGKDEIIGVTFLDGEVVSVDAVNQAPEDGLGTVLEESGLVSRDQFSSLVAENQAGGGRVVDLLVERGFLDRGQLLSALRQQTLRLCEEACAWREGQFRFYRGDQVSYEHGIEPINVDDLLGRLVASDGVAAPPEPAPEPTPAVESPLPAELAPPVAPPSAEPVLTTQQPATEEPASQELTAQGPTTQEPTTQEPTTHEGESFRPNILRLEDMEDVPEIELLDVPPISPPPVEAPTPIEMPDVEPWEDLDDEDDDLDFEAAPVERRPRFDFGVDWDEVLTPLMPGRVLCIGMLVSLAALVIMAPERFLVPLDGQERIRDAVADGVREAQFIKVDQAAKTFFLLRGSFPDGLERLVTLDLLNSGDTDPPSGRLLSYTAAPVSYQLAIENEREGAVLTESIGGNFLLDPDFSPPEIVDTPPLVLLD